MSTTAPLVQPPKGTTPLQTAAVAPGWPGIMPRWTSSAKIGVGTALNAKSRVWFTFSHGIFNPDEAGQCALQSLRDGFDRARSDYVGEWQTWQRTLKLPRNKSSKRDLSSHTIALLRVHESKLVLGGIIASLSIPWGFAKGDDIGGYHLIWPRDLAEAAGGLLAVGARDDVCRNLDFLERTQDKDGHWPQKA